MDPALSFPHAQLFTAEVSPRTSLMCSSQGRSAPRSAGRGELKAEPRDGEPATSDHGPLWCGAHLGSLFVTMVQLGLSGGVRVAHPHQVCLGG